MNEKLEMSFLNLKQTLASFECPFTWDRDEVINEKIAEQTQLEYDVNSVPEFFPLMRLIRCVRNIYIDSKNVDASSNSKILSDLDTCEEVLVSLKESLDPEVSTRVATHIVGATKCFVFHKFGMQHELEQTLQNFENLEKIDEKDESTLLGCKAIFWFKYWRIGNYDTEIFIREAITKNPRVHLWYYVLAKILRHKRRSGRVLVPPTGDEITAFEDAYEMDQNSMYGVYLAQAYRESKDYKSSRKIYFEIWKLKPQHPTILLNLAKGFINLGEFVEAQECLNLAATKSPPRCMYVHYKGMFYMKQERYREALPYLQEAIERNTLSAEMLYTDCMIFTDESFDALQYLISLLDKYNYLPKNQIQFIHVTIALIYWRVKNDLDNAATYFISAIEIDDQAKCLTNYSPYISLLEIKEKNIFQMMRVFLYSISHNFSDNEVLMKKKETLEKYRDHYKNMRKMNLQLDSVMAISELKMPSINVEKALASLECPFTWDRDGVIDQKVAERNRIELGNTDNADNESEFFPLMRLIRCVWNIYIDSKIVDASNNPKILSDLETCGEVLISLRESLDPEVSIKLATHIVGATKCFVFHKLGMQHELEQTLQNIEKLAKIDEKDESTLLACKAIFWFKYCRFGNYDTEIIIREAITKNPRVHLWYYVLAKVLRQKRKSEGVLVPPTEDEILNFSKAYQMDRNSLYGVHLAQVYRENRDHDFALEIYENVFKGNPKHGIVWLRLALGFIQARMFERAKICLDEAATRLHPQEMLAHYTGTFYMKQNKFNEALPHLEKTVQNHNNIAAEMEYTDCMLKTNESFDASEYLISVLKKYEHLPKKRLQIFHLIIAYIFWKIKDDIEKASEYFLSAIEIDPQANCLTNYRSPLTIVWTEDKNIFHALRRDFLFDIHRHQNYKLIIERANKIEQYCNEHMLQKMNLCVLSEMESNLMLSFECPFTWDMDSIDLTLEINYNPEKNYQFFPIAEFAYHVMAVYVSSKRGEDAESIATKLEKCEKDLDRVREEAHPEISLAVAEHVLQGTRAFAYAGLEKEEELKKILSDYHKLKFDNHKERSMLFACRSIVWSKYNLQEAIRFMREAVELNPDCDCFLFILGKELRRGRRNGSVKKRPTEEETYCFEKSYSIAKNQLCGTFYAQMLREDGDIEKSFHLYNEIYESIPEEAMILMRLALGLIRFKEWKKARICLDEVSLISPDHELYLHYEGLYLMETGQFRDALPFLERAITDEHLAVEKDYLKCRTKVDRNFDTTEYILKMLQKYSTFPKHDIQYLRLELSLSYWKRSNDILKALDQFLNAVKLDPKSFLLKKFYTCLNVWIDKQNIFSLLKNIFLPEIRVRYRFNPATQKKIKELEELVNAHL